MRYLERQVRARWIVRVAVPIVVPAIALILAFQNCGTPGGGSSASSSVTPITTGSNTRPSSPTHFTLSTPSSVQINLSWTDASTNEASFKIERAVSNSGPFSTGTGPGAFSIITNAPAGSTSYIDGGLIPSTVYYYRLSATNSAGDSAPTAIVNVTTPAAPSTIPAAPSSVVATATAATVVNVVWADNSNNESNFKVERSMNSGSTYAQVALISASNTSFTDINLSPATAYLYRVRSSNMIGDSANAVAMSVTTPAAGNKATYAYVSANIIGPNCTGCHGATNPSAGINLTTYTTLVAHVTKNNSANSQIITAIMTGGMPPGAPLTTDQISSLKAWIDAGALNN